MSTPTISSYQVTNDESMLSLELLDSKNNCVLHLSMDGRYYNTFDIFNIILPKNMDDIVGSTIQGVKYKYDNGFQNFCSIINEEEMFSDEYSFIVQISTTNGKYIITLHILREYNVDKSTKQQEYEYYQNNLTHRRFILKWGNQTMRSKL
jgi:hypothetical protein